MRRFLPILVLLCIACTLSKSEDRRFLEENADDRDLQTIVNNLRVKSVHCTDDGLDQREPVQFEVHKYGALIGQGMYCDYTFDPSLIGPLERKALIHDFQARAE